MQINGFLQGCALVGLALLAACSSDNDDKVQDPVFPDMQTVEIAVGQAQELTFHADADWKLTIDKSWCRFDNDGAETAQVAGKAGDAAVVVRVTDRNLGFESASAQIMMSMGAKMQPIFEIPRPGRQAEAKMYEKTGYGVNAKLNELEKVTLTYKTRNSSSVNLGFAANFDWLVLSVPEGFTMQKIQGAATEGKPEPTDPNFKTTTIKIADVELLPYARKDKIVISDIDGNKPQEFIVEYTGMGDEDFFRSRVRHEHDVFGRWIRIQDAGRRRRSRHGNVRSVLRFCERHEIQGFRRRTEWERSGGCHRKVLAGSHGRRERRYLLSGKGRRNESRSAA